MISATSCAPIRSCFFLSDFSSRRAVFGFGCVAQESTAASKLNPEFEPESTPPQLCTVNGGGSRAREASTGERVDGRGQSGERVDHSAKLTLSSSGVAQGAPRSRFPHASRAYKFPVPGFPVSRSPDFPISKGASAHRAPSVVLATATPALAALRIAHEHARAERARHAHCTRARLAGDAHALMRQHALARQKQECRARVTGHFGRLAAGTSGAYTLRRCARHLRCARASCITDTLCHAIHHASPTRCACHPPPCVCREKI